MKVDNVEWWMPREPACDYSAIFPQFRPELSSWHKHASSLPGNGSRALPAPLPSHEVSARQPQLFVPTWLLLILNFHARCMFYHFKQ